MEEVHNFVIEDTPVPPRAPKGPKLPFDKMNVGQSFYIPKGFQDIKRVRAASASYGKTHGMKFSIVRDGTGYRCGRIK